MRQRGCFTFFVVLLAFGGFAFMVFSNAEPGEPLRPVIPTDPQPTEIANTWQDVLREGFNAEGSPVPTIPIPDQVYIPPTIARDTAVTVTPINAASVGGVPGQVFSVPVTPTLPPPTPTIPATLDGVTVRQIERPAVRPTSFPALIPPIARHPNDHYWFLRPIDSFGVNAVNYYDYGTDGPRDAPLAIHHGIDLPNDVGTTIRAAAAGTVLFATSQNAEGEDITYQNSPSYGRVVVIEHDYSYRGQRLYTLYAHLLEPLVQTGDYVNADDPIALVGNTGHTTGGHVHFEVMIGTNSYGSTYNPVLWVVPYVGHGTIAGRVVDSRGEFLQDVDVTLALGGVPRDNTTTYVFREVGSRVNPDPMWQENFAFSDVPVGRYEVWVTLNGRREVRVVDVREGMTSFVEFQSSTQPTATPPETTDGE